MNGDATASLAGPGGPGHGRQLGDRPAAAEGFARPGARVVLAARGLERGEAVAREIREGGGDARFVQADVSKAEDVARPDRGGGGGPRPPGRRLQQRGQRGGLGSTRT